MTPEEVQKHEDKILSRFEEVNELFTEFIDVLPFIELQDDESFTGRLFKLRVHMDDEETAFKTVALIFFELQYLLHRYNVRKVFSKDQSETGDYSMKVSKLILSPKIPNTAFRQGYMIKMEYEKKN